MNFSFCLIARNEAKVLPRLLESLKEFQVAGGQVCLLDTGSTDNTAQIARDWGCVVEEVGDKYRHTISLQEALDINSKFVVGFPFDALIQEQEVVKENDTYFDFGSARNHAASLASNDMVSFVDADEVLVNLDFSAICDLIEKGYTQFEYAFVFAHKPDGSPAVEFTQSKFYDRKNMHWNGIIHEVLAGTGNRYFLSKQQFGLEHFQNEETNRGGYLKGLAVDCFNHPENDRNSHYFAREMMWTGRPRSAIKEFERHVAMNRWPAERAQSLIFMGDCYGTINQPEKQVECYNKAFYVCSDKRESLLKLAHFFRHNNNPKATAAYAAAALEIPWSGFYADSKADYEDVPHALLYWAKGWNGDIGGAQYHINKALEYSPYNANYLRDTKFYFEYGAPEIEGWMTWRDLQWLYEMGKKGGTFVEIGSWAGRSSNAVLTGSLKAGGTVYCVDTWKGSKEVYDQTNPMAKERDMLEVFKNNVGHFPNLHIVQKLSIEAAKDFEDGSIDICFIDAGHTEEEVTEDIKAWLPKVKKGGIISGHDYLPHTWMGVVQAVDTAFGKPDGVVDWIWWVTVK
ncbi:MAG: class I SAM-dependent methyltransferase [Patescibacteria group bacterium]